MTEKLFTKNFTLLILGQLTSLFGNFILKLALSMYVLEATGSAAIFAGILSAATIPTILLSPLGGQGRQTEYYGGVRRIDWRISFMCGIILVGKQCHCRNQYVAYYTFYFGCV